MTVMQPARQTRSRVEKKIDILRATLPLSADYLYNKAKSCNHLILSERGFQLTNNDWEFRNWKRLNTISHLLSHYFVSLDILSTTLLSRATRLYTPIFLCPFDICWLVSRSLLFGQRPRRGRWPMLSHIWGNFSSSFFSFSESLLFRPPPSCHKA